jgi:hypothetical protein
VLRRVLVDWLGMRNGERKMDGRGGGEEGVHRVWKVRSNDNGQQVKDRSL